MNEPPQLSRSSSTWLAHATRATWRFLQAFVRAAVATDLIKTCLPLQLPADVSRDGKLKWDGKGWVPIEQPQSQPTAPGWKPPLPISVRAPARGLRIFLLATLMAVITGLFTVFGFLGLIGGPTDFGLVAAFAVFALLFAIATVATIGVARRAAWARVVAIIAGIAISLTCLGLVVGIPILVAAARAPNLAVKPLADLTGEPV